MCDGTAELDGQAWPHRPGGARQTWEREGKKKGWNQWQRVLSAFRFGCGWIASRPHRQGLRGEGCGSDQSPREQGPDAGTYLRLCRAPDQCLSESDADVGTYLMRPRGRHAKPAIPANRRLHNLLTSVRTPVARYGPPGTTYPPTHPSTPLTSDPAAPHVEVNQLWQEQLHGEPYQDLWGSASQTVQCTTSSNGRHPPLSQRLLITGAQRYGTVSLPMTTLDTQPLLRSSPLHRSGTIWARFLGRFSRCSPSQNQSHAMHAQGDQYCHLTGGKRWRSCCFS